MHSTTVRYVAKACCLLPCLMASALHAQFVVLPEKPASLVLQPPVADSPGLVRWFGNPETRVPKHIDATWLRDGRRLYAKSDYQHVRLQVWTPSKESGIPSVKLRGYLPLGDKWAVSPNGQWLCGVGIDKQQFHLLMFNGKDHSGHWQIALPQYTYFEQITFSADEKHLQLVNKIKGGVQLTVLESDTGKMLHQLSKQETEETSSLNSKVAVGNDEIILPPRYDSENRVTRLDTKTWTVTPVTEPMSEWSDMYLTLSDDSQWLIAWYHDRYSLMLRGENGFESKLEGSASYYFNRGGFREDSFEDVTLSPDSSTLVVSGNGMHKIIRVSDQTVVQQSLEEDMRGLFSPDGKTFWQSNRPYRAVNTQTWKIYAEDGSARGEAEDVSFSPNGRRIAINLGNCIEVWALNGKQPEYRLTSQRKSSLADIVWKDNDTIYSGDYTEYLVWKLPASNGQTTQILEGSKLFDTAASIRSRQNDESHTYMLQYLTLDPVNGLCLLSQNTEASSVELRDPAQPGWVRRLKIEAGTPFPEGRAFFSGNGKQIFYLGDLEENYGVLHAYDVTTDFLKKSDIKFPGVMDAYAGTANQLVVFKNPQDRGITIVDGSTLTELYTFYLPEGTHYNYECALSSDGKWLACKVNTSFFDPARNDLMLIDLEQRKIVARTLLDFWVTSMAFSPDNKHFAVGYNNGLVSAWSVERMIATASPVEKQFAGTPPTKPASTSADPKQWKSWDAIPVSHDGFELLNGSKLQINPNAALSDPVAQVRVGDVYINGTAPKALTHQSKRTESKNSKGYQMQAHLKTDDMNLHIQRFIRGNDSGYIQYVDVLENTSDAPLSFTFSFVSSFGGENADLRMADGNRPLLQGGEFLSVPDKTTVLYYVNKRDKFPQVCATMFGNDNAPKPARFRWSPEIKGVLSEWTLTLKAYEQQQIIHQYHQENLPDGQEAWQVVENLRKESQRSTFDWISRLPYLINFGVGEKHDLKGYFHILQHRGLDAQGWRKDDLGMQWQDKPLSAEGMGTEFGADRLLALWLNQQPASFEITRQYGTTKATSQTHQVKESSPVEGKWTVQRRAFWSKEDACYTTQDVVYNPTQEPVQAFVEMAFIGQSKIAALTDSAGNLLWNADGTVDVTNVVLPEQFVIIYEGDNQPGILLTRSTEWTKAMPKLRKQGERGLFLGYEIQLAPKEYHVLSHAAAPRPTAVFGGIRDTFSTWDSQKALSILGEPMPIQAD